MINGFEEETAPLTDKERGMLKMIVTPLTKKVGKENAVTNKQILTGIKSTFDVEIGAARLRKLINHIRLNNIIPRLVATSKGYYIEQDDKELDKYIESLEQRSSAILAVSEALKKQKSL